MLALLRQAQQHGILPVYTGRLLATWDEPRATDTHLHVSHSSALHSSALIEPLTCREREVLGLLLEGATNQEIACHLVLSVNTVKKHILNICGKLNVRSRAQVLAKARTLQLLEEQVSTRTHAAALSSKGGI
jgi:LuxR family maltose regulon positive regulatory protein